MIMGRELLLGQIEFFSSETKQLGSMVIYMMLTSRPLFLIMCKLISPVFLICNVDVKSFDIEKLEECLRKT